MILLLALALLLVAGPAGAFPTPNPSAPTETDTASGTSHAVTLPTCASGKTLLVFSAWDNDSGTITTPGDWTVVVSGATAAQSHHVVTKISTGSDSLTLTIANSEEGAHQAFCIENAHASTLPEGTLAASGTTEFPNPPSHAASWGAEDNLWFVSLSGGQGGTVDAYPANYTNGVHNANVAAGMSVARRELNASSEDPGTWDMSDSFNYRAATIVVRPAAAAAGCGARMMLVGVGC